MENIKNIKVELPNGEFEEITIITNLDGSEVSMPKAMYEAIQADETSAK
jgi:hypothetical protein